MPPPSLAELDKTRMEARNVFYHDGERLFLSGFAPSRQVAIPVDHNERCYARILALMRIPSLPSFAWDPACNTGVCSS